MHKKEQLIHEATKVLKVTYYFIIIFSIKVLLDIFMVLMPFPTKTITKDAQGNIKSITITERK